MRKKMIAFSRTFFVVRNSYYWIDYCEMFSMLDLTALKFYPTDGQSHAASYTLIKCINIIKYNITET